MSTSLFTGLSGLRSFETYLDVVGNNIANSNTVGFRSGRASFGDLLYITSSPGSGPTATIGGRNPQQIGLGVRVKSIDTNTNSGSLLATGRNLDLSISGSGFFVVNDGRRNLYTRAGTFGFDAQGQVIELGSGFLVQDVSGGSIVVPPNAISPPQATTRIDIKGNLPAEVGGPKAEILSTQSPFQTGTAAAVTGSNTGPFTLADGDTFTVAVDGGAAQTVALTAADFTGIGGNIASATAAEVAQVLNSKLTGVTATVSAGAVVLTSDSLGSGSRVKVSDGAGNPAATLGLSTSQAQGTQSAATATTDLNALVTNSQDYVNGDGIEVRATGKDGTEVTGTFTYGVDGTTLGSLQTFVDNLMTDATVALDASGNMIVTATTTGAAQYSLALTDESGNTGMSDFSSTGWAVTQKGTDPDSVDFTSTVYDTTGQAHTVELNFQRVDAQTWDLTATLPDGDGTVTDGLVRNVRFDANGALLGVGGPGADDPNIELSLSTGAQTIDLDFGTLGTIDGLTQFGGPATAQAVFQDGFAAGTLSDVTVTENGEVLGVFSNGQTQTYGTIALATFANPGGMLREGANLFSDTVNSGQVLLGAPGGGGGTIQAGALESSNVDLAEEFVRMIEAQRGYQASARLIRTSGELLQSLIQTI